MRIQIGKFARSGIEERHGADIAAAVETGLLHYTRRLSSGREPVSIPQFGLESAAPSPAEELEVFVEPETEAALEEEARRQQVTLPQLMSHAMLVYLADLDTFFGGTPEVQPFTAFNEPERGPAPAQRPSVLAMMLRWISLVPP